MIQKLTPNVVMDDDTTNLGHEVPGWIHLMKRVACSRLVSPSDSGLEGL